MFASIIFTLKEPDRTKIPEKESQEEGQGADLFVEIDPQQQVPPEDAELLAQVRIARARSHQALTPGYGTLLKSVIVC